MAFGAASLLERWNLINAVETLTLVDDRDIVCLRKSSRKDLRQSKKLESSLNDERSLESLPCSDASLPRFANAENLMVLAAPSEGGAAVSLLRRWDLIGLVSDESWTLMEDDRDVVCLRKSSRKSVRLSKKLESVLDEEHSPESFTYSTASLFNTSENFVVLAASSFSEFDLGKTPSLANLKTPTWKKDAEDGNGHGACHDGCLSDEFSNMSMRPSSSPLLPRTASSSNDWDE